MESTTSVYVFPLAFSNKGHQILDFGLRGLRPSCYVTSTISFSAVGLLAFCSHWPFFLPGSVFFLKAALLRFTFVSSYVLWPFRARSRWVRRAFSSKSLLLVRSLLLPLQWCKYYIRADMLNLNWVILHSPIANKHQQIAKKLRIDESSRTRLTGLSVLWRNEMFIFTFMDPAGSNMERRPKSYLL